MSGTPIPAGALTVDNHSTTDLYRVRTAWDGIELCIVTAEDRAHLLASQRPPGVPDDAVPMTVWLGREGKPEWDDYGREASWCVIFLPDGTDYDSWDADDLRKAGVPVPPYQPTPPEPADSPTMIQGAFNPITGEPVYRRPVAVGGQETPSGLVATPLTYTPPVAAGERTGPLGGYPHLALLETRDRVREVAAITDDELALWEITALTKLVAACRAAVAEWDAEPQPAETIADIASTVVEYGGGRYTLSDYWCAPANGPLNAEWRDKPHRLLYDLLREIERLHFEAATRPDPDTITVNRDDLAEALDWVAWDADPKAQKAAGRLGAALAAAGLPQEPTDTRSRPTREEQRAHLDEGSCRCHDSWDQCPCAEGGHPADGSCGCCPLGTGLCGPPPQEPTEDTDQ